MDRSAKSIPSREMSLPSSTANLAALLLLSGCASDPIELNIAIGYQVSIVTAEAAATAEHVPGPIESRADAYAAIAPGRSR